MLSLSQTTGYAIHALSCLSTDRVLLIREVADLTGIQKPYLAKIINLLTKKNLVTTKRGHSGGIGLARPAEDIALIEIVEAVEGKSWLGGCLLGLRECNSQHICPTHDLWTETKGRLREAMTNATLAEVITNGIAGLDKRTEARCHAQTVEKTAPKPAKRAPRTRPKQAP
jgi:Rrf2 family protein